MAKYNGTIGVLPPLPKQEENLFRIEELVPVPSAGLPPLKETNPKLWKIYPKRDQGTSSSCTYHARAKAAGILRQIATGEFVEYSAADYRKRFNRPNEGSSPVEAMDLWIKEGIGIEVLEPSMKKTDSELALVTQDPFDIAVAGLSKAHNYVALPIGDFDALITTISQSGKPLLIAFFATSKEWNQDVPTIISHGLQASSAGVRHLVSTTGNVGIWNGQPGFTVEDSWGTAGIEGKGVRWITKDFFEKRNYIVPLYPTQFKTYEDTGVTPTRPKVNLTKDLEFGMTDPDVAVLQRVYKHEGLFPVNHQGSMFFHNITLKATQDFQVRYNISSPGQPGYGRVGPKTRAMINKLYS